jgi:hypothetical protein
LWKKRRIQSKGGARKYKGIGLLFITYADLSSYSFFFFASIWALQLIRGGVVYSNIPFSSRFRGNRAPFCVFRVSLFYTKSAVGPRDCGWGVLIVEEGDGVGDKLKSRNHYAVHSGCYRGQHFWACPVFLDCRSIRISGVSAAILKELHLDGVIFHRKTDGKDTTGIFRYSAVQLVLFRNCALVICLISHRNVTQLN